MQIIPVVDLKAGHVVHAKAVKRELYQPIKTPLCQSSKVIDVMAAFLKLYPFRCCYIADLDAINGIDNHDLIINKLLDSYPEIEFIVDAGFNEDFFNRHYPKNYRPILGSECLNTEHLPTLIQYRDQDYILSLDYTLDNNLGPEALFTEPCYWPKNVIIMPLNNVGSFQGPDFERLQHYQSQYCNHNIIAAGGVRNLEDLKQLNKLGINCALVASALHSKAIDKSDLQYISEQLIT